MRVRVDAHRVPVLNRLFEVFIAVGPFDSQLAGDHEERGRSASLLEFLKHLWRDVRGAVVEREEGDLLLRVVGRLGLFPVQPVVYVFGFVCVFRCLVRMVGSRLQLGGVGRWCWGGCAFRARRGGLGSLPASRGGFGTVGPAP